MAMPIRETPILSGNDARVFIEKMKENERAVIDGDVIHRMINNYVRIYEASFNKN